MENNTIYPEMLYKYRRGLAAYKRIEGNIYEDTTCTNHENCRISVKPAGDHFDLLECVNESAKNFDFMHIVSPYDSNYYPTKREALQEIYGRRLKGYERELQRNTQDLPEAERKLAAWSPMHIGPQDISILDFDDKVYITRYAGVWPETCVINVVRKIFSKKGLVCLEAEYTAGGDDVECYVIMNTDDGDFLDVTKRRYREYGEQEYYDTDHYKGFVSEDDFNSFVNNNEKKEKLNREVRTFRENIEYYSEKIEETKRKYNDAVNE